MTDHLTNELTREEIETFKPLLEAVFGTPGSKAARICDQLVATMQENDRLMAEVEKLKQWRELALAIGENAKRELERREREEEDEPHEVSDAG